MKDLYDIYSFLVLPFFCCTYLLKGSSPPGRLDEMIRFLLCPTVSRLYTCITLHLFFFFASPPSIHPLIVCE
ncbi:unnamed protein product [Arctogadus glacialis]